MRRVVSLVVLLLGSKVPLGRQVSTLLLRELL